MAAHITGELKTWHKVSLEFVADQTFTESASTFRDHRLDVTFTHKTTGTTLKVPGFFDADGNAANTNATSGGIWRVNFNAPLEGEWTYKAAFRTGNDIAASRDPFAGRAVSSIDGEAGGFQIAQTDKAGEDFRAKGMILQDQGTHYLQHQGDGDYFVRGGPGVPENFLASADVDNTPGTHDYSSHRDDINTGDPTWDGGKGKGILGAVNYLAEQGQNSAYIMLLTAAGDGKDVWPWAATNLGNLAINTSNLNPAITSVYDVSKLAQWEKIFDHMDEKGIYKNLLLQEMENDQLLDGGTDVAGTSLSAERLIYMREMIARFGHSNGVQWNLGEENTNSTQARIDMADWAKAVDPYDHLVVLHTLRDRYDGDFDPLRGVDDFDGPSFLATSEQIRGVIAEFRDKSAAAGDPWVLSWDEDSTKVIDAYSNNPDSTNEKALREGLWGSLTAGGSGFSWYVKGSSGHSYDQNMDTFDAFRSVATWTEAATDFFNTQIPFWEMREHDELTADGGDYVMANPGEVYTIYLPYGEAGDVRLDLTKYPSQSFEVSWYNPRTGGALIADGVVAGGSVQQIGGAPSDTGKDWVLLVREGDPIDGGEGDGDGEETGGNTGGEPIVSGYYLEKNGLVKVQFEDVVNGAAGWVQQSARNGNNPGFEGDGYYYWKDQSSTALNKTPGAGVFTVKVFIEEAGTYNLFLRAARDSNNPSDARNDVWVKVDGSTIAAMPDGAPAMVSSDGYAKLYGLHGTTAKTWNYAKNFDDKYTNNNPAAKVELDRGFHTLTFSGRSDGFHIDSFQLTKGSSPNTSIVSSEFVEGTTQPDPEPQPEPNPDPVTPPSSYDIDAGGTGDRGFVGGKTYTSSDPIAGTTEDRVYQTERYGDFDYSLALANGDYEVTLQFAEIYFNSGGKRVFDVKAEGQTVINDLDIWKAAGGQNVAHEVVVPVSVRDGKLDLEFLSEVNNAKISGIEVSPAGADGGTDGGTDGGSTDGGTGGAGFVAPFALSGPSFEMEDVFLFAFGTDGRAASLGRDGGLIGVADEGSGFEVDYNRNTTAKSEKIGFDFKKGVDGIALDLAGLGAKDGAREGAIFRTYDAAGEELDRFLLTDDAPKTLDFGAPVRFASLESSPWLSDGSLPSTEPDFSLQGYDLIV